MSHERVKGEKDSQIINFGCTENIWNVAVGCLWRNVTCTITYPMLKRSQHKLQAFVMKYSSKRVHVCNAIYRHSWKKKITAWYVYSALCTQ